MLAPSVSKATGWTIGTHRADLLELAPRVGVEPTSLVLIQSQAGPAGRPTGDRAPRLGPAVPSLATQDLRHAAVMASARSTAAARRGPLRPRRPPYSTTSTRAKTSSSHRTSATRTGSPGGLEAPARRPPAVEGAGLGILEPDGAGLELGDGLVVRRLGAVAHPDDDGDLVVAARERAGGGRGGRRRRRLAVTAGDPRVDDAWPAAGWRCRSGRRRSRRRGGVPGAVPAAARHRRSRPAPGPTAGPHRRPRPDRPAACPEKPTRRRGRKPRLRCPSWTSP